MKYIWLDLGTNHTSACAPIHTGYWKEKINVGANHNKIADNLLKFPDLKITSSEMIGNYECLIKEQEDQVVSSKSNTLDLKVMFPFIFIVQSVSEIFIKNYQRLI